MKNLISFLCVLGVVMGILPSLCLAEVKRQKEPQEEVMPDFLLKDPMVAMNEVKATTLSLGGTRDDRENRWRKEIALTVSAILTNTVAERQGILFVDLESDLRKLDGGHLLSLNPAERERFVQSAIGEDGYRALEGKLLRQLKEESDTMQASAAWVLGCVLFSSRSEALLREAVFSNNFRLQLKALQALNAIGVSGVDSLLLFSLLSGALPSTEASFVVKMANSLKDREMIGRYGIEILRNNRNDPSVAHALLPALQTRGDFKQVAIALLTSDVWKIPNTANSKVEDLSREAFVSGLLRPLMTYKPPDDPALASVFRYYANDTIHSSLHMMALFFFERSGEDETFFRQLLQNPENPPEKVKALNNILQRIQRDERLRFEEEAPQPEKQQK